MTDRKLLYRFARNDLATFIHMVFQRVAPGANYQHNWHIEAIAWHLEQCAAGMIKRLLITMPPRHLKSISASVAFPAWLLGRDPSKQIMCASYSADLASDFSRQTRMVMDASWYKQVFPRSQISPLKDTEMFFETTLRGYRFATSVGGPNTGFGGDFSIIDDPIKTDEASSEAKRSAVIDWFTNTASTRLNDPANGVIIVVMQRLHVDDLAGHLLQQLGWTHLSLPAIAMADEMIQIGPNKFYSRSEGDLLHEQRVPRWFLDELKSSMRSLDFSAQYLQCPVPDDGEMIKWPWFRYYERLPPPEDDDMLVQSWDTASTPNELSDYSVCITARVRGNLCYVIDVLRQRLDYPDLRRTVIEHALKWCADAVVIENKGSGMQLLQEFSRAERGMPTAISFTPDRDKVTRMYTQCAKIESGHVLLPRDATWFSDFKSELLQFPKGRYDDQVDSLSQLLIWLGEREVHFSADFGKSEDHSNRAVVAPVAPIKPKILVERKVGGRLKWVRWDPENGFDE